MPRRTLDISEFVGVSEIANLCGVSKQAVANWQARDVGFPAPLAELECGPVFYWPDVKKWIITTGRNID